MQKPQKLANRSGNVAEASFADVAHYGYLAAETSTAARDSAKLAVLPLGAPTHHAHLAESPLGAAT